MAKRRSSRQKQSSTNGSSDRSSASTTTSTTQASAPTGTPPEAPAVTEVVTTGEALLEKLQAALKDLDSKLAAADRTLESLAEGIDFPEMLGETLENLQASVTQLKQQLPEAIRYNTESIVALHSQVADLEKALAQIPTEGGTTGVDESAIADLRTRIQDLDRQLAESGDGELQQAIADCQQRIETELQERESAGEQLRSQLAKLEEQLAKSADLPSDLVELPQTLEALRATVSQLENRGTAEATRAEEIEASIRSIQSVTESLEARFVEALEKQIAEAASLPPELVQLPKTLEALQVTVNQLEERGSDEAKRTEEIEASIRSIQSVTESLEARLAEAIAAHSDEDWQTAFSELTTKLEELQQQLPEAVSYNTQSIVSLNEQLTGIEDTLQQVTETRSEPDEGWQAAFSELTTKLEKLQQQLPEAVSYNTQSIVSLNEQLAGVEDTLKQVRESSEGDESKEAIAQLEQSFAQVEEQLQQALAATELVEGLQSAQQSLEARIQETADLIADRPSVDQFAELQKELESRTRTGTLDAIIQRAEALEQKPTEPPTWEVDLEELRSSIDLLSRRIPEAYQVNSETTTRLEAQIGELQAQITQLAARPEPATTPEAIAELEKAIAALQATQTEIQTQLDAAPESPADSSSEEIRSIVTELTERLDSLSQQLPEAVSYNTQSIVSLNEHLAGLEERSRQQEDEEGARAASTEVSGAIARIDEQLATSNATDERLEMLEISYDDIDKRMDAVDLKVVSRASEQQLNEVQKELATKAGAQELEDALSQLNELKEAVSNPVPLWQEDIEAIRVRLDSVVAQLPEVIQFNTETAVQLETQVAALQEQLAERQSDDETSETIAKLQKQLEKLQESLETQGNASQLTDANLRSFGQDLARLAERIEQLRVEQDQPETAPWREELQAISTRLEETAATVNEQVAAVTALQAREEQTAEPDEVEAGEAEPSEAIVKLRTDVDALQPILEKSSELESQMSTFATTLYALQSTITPLEQQLPEALRYNTQSVVELHEQMEELKQQVQETNALDTSGELEAIKADYRKLIEAWERDRDAIAKLGNTFSELEGKVADKDRSEASAVDAMEKLQRSLSELESKVADKDKSDASTIDDAIAKLQQTLTELESKVADKDNSDAKAVDELAKLQQALSELESKVADKSDVSEIAPIQAELASLLAIHERQNQQCKQEELQQEFLLLTEQFIQLEKQLPEAIRLNTQSIVMLQENLQGVESHLEGDRDGERIDELRAELEGLMAQQKSLKVWLVSSVGVAVLALAAAVSQFLGLQLGV